MSAKPRASKKAPAKTKKPRKSRAKPPAILAASVPDLANDYDDMPSVKPPRWYRRLLAWLAGENV